RGGPPAPPQPITPPPPPPHRVGPRRRPETTLLLAEPKYRTRLGSWARKNQRAEQPADTSTDMFATAALNGNRPHPQDEAGMDHNPLARS
ncbi:MAG: hypothetical protein VX346_00055, partial [Planctomycetota bacterium]|nr:hypothetical protein [Planctomycetota bacterium]